MHIVQWSVNFVKGGAAKTNLGDPLPMTVMMGILKSKGCVVCIHILSCPHRSTPMPDGWTELAFTPLDGSINGGLTRAGIARSA